MILKERCEMSCDKPGGFWQVAAIPTDVVERDWDGTIFEQLSFDMMLCEWSNGNHSPQLVAILAYLMASNFVITPCAALMDHRPPDLRLVRVVHSFTGRVVLETTHPRLWQVRVFLLQQWTWNAIRTSLPEGYCKFNVELIHDNRPLNAFRALMSITEEDTLEVGYVIKELRVPSPRTRRAMTEAIARHQSDLIYNFLSKYKVPDLVKVIRGETISPVSLLLWAPSLWWKMSREFQEHWNHCWRLVVRQIYRVFLPERHCR